MGNFGGDPTSLHEYAADEANDIWVSYLEMTRGGPKLEEELVMGKDFIEDQHGVLLKAHSSGTLKAKFITWSHIIGIEVRERPMEKGYV